MKSSIDQSRYEICHVGDVSGHTLDIGILVDEIMRLENLVYLSTLQYTEVHREVSGLNSNQDDFRDQILNLKYTIMQLCKEFTYIENKKNEFRTAAEALADHGSIFAEALTRVQSKPWVALRHLFQRKGLGLLARLIAPLSRRTADRFERSLERRGPSLHWPDWNAVRERLAFADEGVQSAFGNMAKFLHDHPLEGGGLPAPAPRVEPGSTALRPGSKPIAVVVCSEDLLRSRSINTVVALAACTFRDLGFKVIPIVLGSDRAPFVASCRSSGFDAIVAASEAEFDRITADEIGRADLVYVFDDVATQALGPRVAPLASTGKVIAHLVGSDLSVGAKQNEADGKVTIRVPFGGSTARFDHVAISVVHRLTDLEAMIAEHRCSLVPGHVARISTSPAPFEARADFVLIDSVEGLSNIEIAPLLDTVWRPIRERLATAQLFVVAGHDGSLPAPFLGAEGVVAVRRDADDLAPVLATARVGLSQGLRDEASEAMHVDALAAGLPFVVWKTPGLLPPAVTGGGAPVCDDAAETVARALELHGDADIWRQHSTDGRTHCRETFGAAAHRTALLRVLDRAGVLPLKQYIDYCRRCAPNEVPTWMRSDPVDVSIIVPVYAKWQMTRRCLNSIQIAARGTGLRYELILADDNSPDATRSAAYVYPGMRISWLAENRGFLINSKTAAACARGRYLMFLNNDTVVLPDWLSELVTAMDADPRIAIGGSKLLYPDGSIQESGAVLFSDGTANSLGRGMARDTPIHCLDREVDYVTGASVLIRSDFWRDIGGFDERYAPAYCEDSDLAMEARNRGLRVMCVPRSVVIHFEHGSYAEQDRSLPRQLQIDNGEKLLDKWRDVFRRDHLEPGSSVGRAAANAERLRPVDGLARLSRGHDGRTIHLERALRLDDMISLGTLTVEGENDATVTVTVARRIGARPEERTFALVVFGDGTSSAESPSAGVHEITDVLSKAIETIGALLRLEIDDFHADEVVCRSEDLNALMAYVPRYMRTVRDRSPPSGPA